MGLAAFMGLECSAEKACSVWTSHLTISFYGNYATYASSGNCRMDERDHVETPRGTHAEPLGTDPFRCIWLLNCVYGARASAVLRAEESL